MQISDLKAKRSPLHLAVLENCPEAVRGLNTARSLCKARDIYNLTPLDLAHLLDRREILALLQQKRIDSPVFETREDLEEMLAMTAKAKQSDKISSEKIWLGVYFDKEISLGLHPPIAVRSVDANVGLGVFAEKTIAPCSYVGEYTGRILHKKRNDLEGKRYCVSLTSAWGKLPFSIDGESQGNFTRYINHDKEGNLGLQSVYWRGLPRMVFFALREIKPGEQLTFDYGDKYWKELSETPQPL